MFLCLGINVTGQTITMSNVFTFVKKGANRFFLSLKNRKELAEAMFKENLYKGKYCLTMDYYPARAVFDAAIIDDTTLNEWNAMMKPICIKGHHGVKVVRVQLNQNDSSEIKYMWHDRWINLNAKPKSKKAKAKKTK